jgi:lipid II isoglutaminyl synthase (glutamine-hydrolysing)
MMTADSPRSLVLGHLYPSLMNLYGDRGNITCLRYRCEARGIELEVREIGLADEMKVPELDLAFIGGGQDREQWRIGEDLALRKGPSLRKAVDDGLPLLAVCGGYQLMGHYYQTADGRRLQGLGIFDLVTESPSEDAARCIGNVAVRWDQGDLVGFENHGGRTYLGEDAVPLGTVLAGFGNNGHDGTEGCRRGNALGTYVHGSLLPKNPALADYILAQALKRKYGSDALGSLDDGRELAAHETAASIAGAEAGRYGRSLRRLRGLLRLGR